MSEQQVLTLRQFAKYWQVSERTAWQLARDGKVPCFRVGNQYRFLKSLLEAEAKKRSQSKR